ncbi:hypothetical protein Tco_1006378 [Tanacetum coccineum]|uniref:Uncharacterized protein n=1 Tax=Tanacetum coccineum TaxID=301880 RepID=A0ABQ5FHR3_9ASTR
MSIRFALTGWCRIEEVPRCSLQGALMVIPEALMAGFGVSPRVQIGYALSPWMLTIMGGGAKNLMLSLLDFNKKLYNSLGRAPNRCSSSIGKTQGVVIVHSRNRLGRLDHGLTEF